MDLDRHQHFGHVVLDGIEHLAKQLERFALVFLFGLLLGIAAQVNALAQVVQRTQMFAPMRVNALQQHHTFKLQEVFVADLFNF